MSTENYIVINGKRAELTEEQLKQLGIEVNKHPFERQPKNQPFYFITNKAKVEYGVEVCDFHCNGLFEVANYCTDKGTMEQRALHETLSRLLWRYSMEHNGDKIDWSNRDSKKYFIYYNNCSHKYGVDSRYDYNFMTNVFFYEYEIAESAIKEIVEPFMKEHPKFKW